MNTNNLTKMTKNSIFLTKSFKVVLPSYATRDDSSDVVDNFPHIITIIKNIESLGILVSKNLFNALRKLCIADLNSFYLETISVLKEIKGAHRKFEPMYPNYPQQVIDTSLSELYFNALSHYWDSFLQDVGVILGPIRLPQYDKEERPFLRDNVKYEHIDLGTELEFIDIFKNLIGSKSSISEYDKTVIKWFVYNYRQKVLVFLPDEIPYKENLSILIGELISIGISADHLFKYFKTPTDVLRVAVALSGGDVSLFKPSKFKNFSRPIRKFLLSILELFHHNKSKEDILSEMNKYRSRWVKLGEFLHPGDYNFLRNTYDTFSALRSKHPIRTFNSKVEVGIINDKILSVIKLLKTRPGEFARRLDHLIRINPSYALQIVYEFNAVADKVSIPVLLQVYAHFKNKENSDIRVIIPKGITSHTTILNVPKLDVPIEYQKLISNSARTAIIKQLKFKNNLGNVYIDPNLKNYLVPFSQRSASKALKTIVRGSKIPVDFNNIRLFLWWKQPKGVRVDVDLGCSFLDENLNMMGNIAYYNLKNEFGCHSGDIVSAQNGACEFIDFNISNLKCKNVRYALMMLFSFTKHSYADLPECFAGFMSREHPNSGEIFEPKTVENKFDISCDDTCCVPFFLDLKTNEIFWADLTYTGNFRHPNNALNQRKSLQNICKIITELNKKKANLYDLLEMHAEARGKRILNPKHADVIFDSKHFPFEIDNILNNYL
jgi:hypothetical protein